MTQIKSPKIFCGKTREHSNFLGADGKTIDYRGNFGEINFRFTNSSEEKDKNNLKLSVEVGNDPMNDEFGLCQETSFFGNAEACSDEAMQYLSRYLMKINTLRKDIKKTIDFFANTMVGNGKLSSNISDLEDANRDADLLNEAMDVIIKENDDE